MIYCVSKLCGIIIKSGIHPVKKASSAGIKTYPVTGTPLVRCFTKVYLVLLEQSICLTISFLHIVNI
jgi:hypothetical protein